MTAEAVFSAANTAALLAWLLLIVAPRWRKAATIAAGLLVPVGLAVLYAVLLAGHWGEGRGGFSSLADVAALFENRWVLLAGWVHYLAFDLFIGAWQVRDAARRDVPHLLVVPCLLLTFLLGPLGLLLYLTIRTARTRRVSLAES